MKRKAKISRKTKETNIIVEVNLDGRGKYNIKTGIGLRAQINKRSVFDSKPALADIS